MIDICGIAGAWLFVFKVSVHIYLLTKIIKDLANRTTFSHNSFARAKLFLPLKEVVPKKFEWLKAFTNIIYFISITLLIIFLIGVNFHKR